MKRRTFAAALGLAFALALHAAMVPAARAMVLHPADDPPTGLATPPAEWLGKWSSNASFVVIGPNHIVTTRHQLTNPGTVTVGSVTYTLVRDSSWVGGPSGSADIQVLALVRSDGQPGNLTSFAPLYTGRDEVGRTATMGGFGKTRGSSLGNPVYGYSWTEGDRQLHWGRNTLTTTEAMSITAGGLYLFSDVVKLTFDGVGRGDYVKYEGAVADYDSGGGWFLGQTDSWKLAALNAYTPRSGQTWFDNPATGPYDPDWNAGIRISSYAKWINAILGYVRVPGDADEDGDVDFYDYTTVKSNFGSTSGTWAKGDFDGDSDVDFFDFLTVKEHFGYVFVPQPSALAADQPAGAAGGAVPEPGGAVLLLCLGAVGLLRRRRRCGLPSPPHAVSP